MGLTDVFKPKWKHSAPDVRLDAVKRLTMNDSEILRSVAMNDTDGRVRVAAILKISDPDLLATIARDKKADDPVKKACADRFIQIEGKVAGEVFGRVLAVIQNENDLGEIALKTDDSQIKKELMERIKDGRLLWRIASEAIDPMLKPFAVSRISDEALLAHIAQENCGAKAGEMIVEALSSPKYLAQVAEKASSRKIRKMAEARIKPPVTPSEAPIPSKETHPDAAFESLLSRMKEIASQNETSGSQNEIKWIEASLASLDPEKGHPLRKRFDELKTQIEARGLDRKKREETQKRLEDILKEIEDAKKAPADGLASLIEEATGKWAGVDMTLLSSESREVFNERFQSGIARLNSLLDTHLLLIEKKKEAEAAARREASARKAEEEEKALLLKLLETVEAASEGERFYEAEPTVKSAKEAWRKAGDRVPHDKKELSDRFEAALTRFFDKLFEHRENRSWEKWANLNQKKELCAAVEALLNEHPLSGLANRVRDIFATWKSIGPVDRDESDRVWERFRLASDTIYERCALRKQEILNDLQAITSGDETGHASDSVKKLQEEWNEIGILPPAFEKEMKDDFRKCVDDYFNRIRERFEKREQERLDNLEIKKSLLDRAKVLMSEPYGRKVVDEIIELQKKWKATGPIPKSLGDGLWEEFRSTCNQFFERIDHEQGDNLKAKEALCEEAEKLVGAREEGLTDDQVRSRLIDLQQKWKEIGPVPRDDSETVWKRFRSACDTFFNTYEEGANERYEEKEKLVMQAESLKASEDWKGATEALKALQQEWKGLGAFQTAKDRELWDRFHEACDTFFTRKREVFQGKESQKQEVLKKRETLLTHAELLVRMIHPEMEFEHLKSIPMNEQLRLSLSYRDEILVPDDEKSTLRNVMRKIGEIRSQWHKLDKASGNADRELWTHFLSVEKAIGR